MDGTTKSNQIKSNHCSIEFTIFVYAVGGRYKQGVRKITVKQKILHRSQQLSSALAMVIKQFFPGITEEG